MSNNEDTTSHLCLASYPTQANNDPLMCELPNAHAGDHECRERRWSNPAEPLAAAESWMLYEAEAWREIAAYLRTHGTWSGICMLINYWRDGIAVARAHKLNGLPLNPRITNETAKVMHRRVQALLDTDYAEWAKANYTTSTDHKVTTSRGVTLDHADVGIFLFPSGKFAKERAALCDAFAHDAETEDAV